MTALGFYVLSFDNFPFSGLSKSLRRPNESFHTFVEKDITPEVKQKRQSKYREELQAQMKEREIQKKRCVF